MSIASRISSIEEHLKESYQELEGIGIDTTGVNNNLENIPKLLDGYWETLPKVTDEGTSITLDNTKEGKMKVLLKGNTYQDSTTGKNKLQYTLDSLKAINTSGTWNNNVYTYNGVTFTVNDDLSITVNGTSTGVSTITFTPINDGLSYLTSGTEYILSGCPSGGSPSTYSLRLYTGTNYATDRGSGLTFTYGDQDYTRIQISSGVSVSNLLFKPMIRLATISDDTYEKPTFGASPNPDYPQEVHVVSGDNEVEVVGKNLFNINGDVNTRYDGSTPSNPQNTVLNGDLTTITNTNNFHPFGQKIYVGAGNTIYFSAKLKSVSYSTTPSDSASVGGISIYNDSTPTGRKTLSYTYSELNTYKSDSITATTDYIYLCFGRSGNVNNTTFTDIMLSSSNDTTYKPYQRTTYPINLPEGMFLGSIGDYKDRLFKNSGNQIWDEEWELGGLNTSGGTTTDNDRIRSKNFIRILPNTNYYCKAPNTVGARFYDQNQTFIEPQNITNTVFTTPQNAYYMKFMLLNTTTYKNDIMINEGSTSLPYEPYGSNEWYLEKKIGKIIYDGSENGWSSLELVSGKYQFYIVNSLSLHSTSNINTKSNYFIGILIDNRRTIFNVVYTYTNGIAFNPIGITTIADWKTWLGTHNTEVYYVLATPTYTKIEGTLASQLEALNGARSYTGQTNIGQENNDLASVLNATALSNGTITPSLQGIQTLSLGQNVDLQTQEPIEEQTEEVEEQGEEL